MKHLFKIVLGTLFALSLTNCKVTKNGNVYTVDPEEDETDLVDNYQRKSDEMEYFHGNWFGQAPNWDLRLNLKVSGKKVLATATVPECSFSAEISQSLYDKLEISILNAKVVSGNVQSIDGGDRTIELKSANKSSAFYLGAGDTSYGKKVIENYADIQKQVESIATLVFGTKECKKQNPNDVQSVMVNTSGYGNLVIRQSGDIPTADDYVAQRPLNQYAKVESSLNFSISGSSLIVSGIHRVATNTILCSKSFSNAITKIPASILAKVTLERSNVICMIAEANTASQTQVIIQRVSGDKEVGYFGCSSDIQVRGADELLKYIESINSFSSNECVY